MRRFHVIASWDSADGRQGDTLTEPLNTRAEAFMRAEETLQRCERRHRTGVAIAIFDNLLGTTVEIRPV